MAGGGEKRLDVVDEPFGNGDRVCSLLHREQGVGLDHRSDRHQGKGIGCPVAHLLVDMLTADRAGQIDMGDQFAAFDHVVVLRLVAGQAVEVADRDAAGAAVGRGALLGALSR